MIYLIGGAPRCGKTKIAKALAEKTHFPWFPADYLGAVVFPYIPENEQGTKFPLKKILQTISCIQSIPQRKL